MNALMRTMLVVLGCLYVEPVAAQPAKDPVYDAIMQRTHEWADAELAADVDKLSQIIGDDWTANYPGHFATKASLLSRVKAGTHKLLTCELGPHEIKAYGDIAVVQGMVTERRDGIDGIIHAAYLDVWAKRGGKWFVVRSLSKTL